MFDSSIWLLCTFALMCTVILFFVLRKIVQYLGALFYPFKKGKKYWCTVIAVSDGDTITCKRLNVRRSVTKVRLAYIDAPESSQAYGKETQRMVMSLVYKKMVRIRIIDKDRYGRHVAEVHRRRWHINEELIKRGAAWVYTDYIKDKTYAAHLNRLQKEAKKDKRGLWRNSKPVNPREYRKMN